MWASGATSSVPVSEMDADDFNRLAPTMTATRKTPSRGYAMYGDMFNNPPVDFWALTLVSAENSTTTPESAVKITMS